MAELDIDAISTVVGQAPQTPDAVKIKPTLLNIDEVSTVAPESSMLNTIRQLAGGFNEAFYYYPDMGYKAIAKSFADEGLIEKDEITGLTEFFNQNVPEPQTTADKVFRTAGQETAKAIPYLATPYLLASSKIYTGVQPIKTTAEEVVKTILNQMRNSPTSTFFAEQLATLGFGVGKGLAEETAPDSVLAQSVYPIAGALAPATASSVVVKTPTAIAFKLGNKLKNYFGSKAQEQRAVEGMSQQFESALSTPDAQTNLAKASQLKEKIGDDYVLSPAEQSGSPQLIASQKQIEADATGSDLDMLVKRKENNLKAIEGYKVKHFPSDGDEAPFIYDTFSKKFNDLSNINSIQAKNSVDKLDEISTNFPYAEKAVIGANLRSEIKNLRTQAVDDFNKYADELNVKLDEKLAFDPLKNVIASTLKLDKKFKLQSRFGDKTSLPDVLYDIKKIKKDGTITFGELKDLRERVSNDLLDALSSANPKKQLIRNLSAVQKDIDNYLDEQAKSLGKNYVEFRKAYKERIINRFEKSGAYKVKTLGNTQEYTIANEKVADAFLTNVDSARQFKTVFTNAETGKINQDALQSLENVILDRIRRKAFKGDVVDANKLKNFINTNREVLQEFPSILSKLDTEQKVIQKISNRVSQLNNRKSLIEESLLAKKLSFEKNPIMEKGAEIDKVITNAIKEPKLMYKIANRLKTNEEKEALRKSVAKIMFGTTDIVNNPDKLKNIINANYNSLKYVFNVEHINNMKTIADAYKFALTTPMPQGMGNLPEGMINKVEDFAGTGLSQVASRVFAVKSGRTSARFMLSDFFARFFVKKQKQKAEAIFKEAMFNPKVATQMAEIANAKIYKPEMNRKLNLVLFNLGYPETIKEKDE